VGKAPCNVEILSYYKGIKQPKHDTQGHDKMEFTAKKEAFKAALLKHSNREVSLRAENPAWVSMVARYAAKSTMDPANRNHVNWIAHYAFVIGFTPKESTEMALADIGKPVPAAMISRR